MIHIANKTYEVVVDHKNGWKPDAFKERFSDVLERYDYIVGDWGYNQLRMRGFFKDSHPKATKESTIATLQDYLNEYCNFGCAYFIIEKVPSKHMPLQQSDSDDAGDQEEQDELLEASPAEREESPQPQQGVQQHTRHQRPHHSHQQRRQQHYNKQQSQQQQQNSPKS
jgi:uncharacterized protein YutD